MRCLLPGRNIEIVQLTITHSVLVQPTFACMIRVDRACVAAQEQGYEGIQRQIQFEQAGLLYPPKLYGYPSIHLVVPAGTRAKLRG